MTEDEADKILNAYYANEKFDCTCHLGHPPCRKCTLMPSKELFEEAMETLRNSICSICKLPLSGEGSKYCSAAHNRNRADKKETCPKCGTILDYVWEIGKFCPNPACSVIDNIHGETAFRPNRNNEKEPVDNIELRRYLWLNHGNNCLPYGDDGEMQCCGVDFKRGNLIELIMRFFVIKENYEYKPYNEFMPKKIPTSIGRLSNIVAICVDYDGYKTVEGLKSLIDDIKAYASKSIKDIINNEIE